MSPFWVGVCIGAGALLVFQFITAVLFAKWFIPDEEQAPIPPRGKSALLDTDPVTLSHEFGRAAYELHNQDRENP